MTLAAAASKVILNGDGATTAFPYTFAINTTDGTDITVYVIDSTGFVTQLTGNYSVNVAGSKVNYPTVGGVAPLAAGINVLPAGWQIVLVRAEPLSQNLALTNQGVFDAASIMTEFDKITMILQQLQEQIDRCVKYPINTAPASADVNAFIAAVSAAILPALQQGTMAYLKNLSASAPSTYRFGFATDLGAVGELMFYCGNASIGDLGWIALGGG